MGALLLPSRFSQQPTEYAQLNSSGVVRRPVAAFIPSLLGLKIVGDGKRDLYGKSTGPAFSSSPATYGVAAKGTTPSTSTFRLNSLANQLDTVWEKPSAQVTVMLVFKRTGTPAGTAPIFSNQCPNNDPFCAWGLFDQTTDFAGFETSSGGVNKRLNSSTVIPNNQLVVLIGRYDGAKMELFQNGIKVGSLAATGSIVYPNVSDRGPSVGNFYNFTGSNRSAIMEVYGGALWDVGISDQEVAALSQNPWQLFAGPPRRLWSTIDVVGTVTGTLAVSEGLDTAVASGSVVSTSVNGALARSEGGDTLASSGAVSSASITGSLSQSEGADTATGSGAVASTTVTGTFARSEGGDTAAGAGTTTFAPITGAGAASEGADTAVASGAIGNAAMGTLARQEGADTLTAAGAVAYPAITASLARQETPDSLVASGSLLFAITGMMAAIELPDTLKASSPAPAAPKLNLYTIMRDSAINLSAPLGGSVNLAGSISPPVTNLYTIMRDTSINLTAPLGVSINLTGKLL